MLAQKLEIIFANKVQALKFGGGVAKKLLAMKPGGSAEGWVLLVLFFLLVYHLCCL